MAHFARIDINNIVQAVHVIDNEHLMNEDGVEEESLGILYLKEVHGEGFTWVQTSYNSNFRKIYASVGDTYDSEKDAFIKPQPFPSWTLNEDTCQWEAPIPFPNKEDWLLGTGKYYYWIEGNEDPEVEGTWVEAE